MLTVVWLENATALNFGVWNDIADVIVNIKILSITLKVSDLTHQICHSQQA